MAFETFDEAWVDVFEESNPQWRRKLVAAWGEARLLEALSILVEEFAETRIGTLREVRLEALFAILAGLKAGARS